jgi:hypothetical protein
MIQAGVNRAEFEVANGQTAIGWKLRRIGIDQRRCKFGHALDLHVAVLEQPFDGHCQLSGPSAPSSGPARLERGSTIGEQRSSPTRAAAPPTERAYHGPLSRQCRRDNAPTAAITAD